jgi:amidase
MNRRNFLQAGSLTGLSILTARISGLSAPKETFSLEETTVMQLQDGMRTGKTSAVALTQAYLNRIKSIDQQGPRLNSVLEINPDALSDAAVLDKERKQGKVRGPLHGVPVLVKDNINTAGKMMTTAGSLALMGNYAKEDAFIIAKLRAAGAVILGKTNLSEWANFRSSHSSSGWSSRGGQTKNPYMLDRSPSGSSSGSGAATAANLCAIAIGTETDGSIVCPSSVNGLVGIKPTVGLLSRTGIIPISATQDTAGPMARNLQDAVVLLGALTGVDPHDPATAGSKSFTDYTQFLDKNGLKGKKIGVESSHFDAQKPGLTALLEGAIKVLEAQGATVVKVDVFEALKVLGHSEYQVLLYEFKDGVNKYLATTNLKVRTLTDVIAFNRTNKDKAMPFFDQDELLESNEKGDLSSQAYIDALATARSSRKILTDLMSNKQLDALIGITCAPAGCIDLINGDYDTGASFSTPAAVTGFPHITVPMGQLYGLPVGLSFMAKPYEEPALISMAFAYEQASKMRKAPGFKKEVY